MACVHDLEIPLYYFVAITKELIRRLMDINPIILNPSLTSSKRVVHLHAVVAATANSGVCGSGGKSHWFIYVIILNRFSTYNMGTLLLIVKLC